MKKVLSIIIVLALSLVAAAGFAQTLVHLQDINVGAYGSSPTGLAFYNDRVFTVTFNDRRIVVVDQSNSPYPAVSVFATTSDADDPVGAVNWSASGRGLTGIDINQTTGKVYVAGDEGVDGHILSYDANGTLIDNHLANYTGGAHNYGSVAIWGDGVLATQRGSGMFDLLDDFSAFDATSYLGGADPYLRDIAVVGDDFYVSRTNGGATNGIVKFSGGTAGALDSYTQENNWVNLASGTWNAASGVYYWDYNGTTPMDYIVFANQVDNTVDLYDITDSSKDITLGTSEEIYDPYDACVGEIDGEFFLFVTQYATSDPLVFESRISVFGIDGAQLHVPTSAKEWAIYE